MPTKKQFDYAEIERAAAEEQTKASFSRRIKIGATNVAHFLRSDEEFAVAYRRGIETRAQNAPTGNTISAATAEDFHRCGIQNLSFGAIAAAFGTNPIGVSRRLKYAPELREAYEKGKAGLALDGSFGIAGELEKIAARNEAESENKKLERGLLDEKVFAAVAGKLFFLPDIAGYLKADRTQVFNSLARLAESGRIVRDTFSDLTSYRIAGEQNKPDEIERLKTESSAAVNEAPRDKILKAIGGGCRLSRAICTATGLPIETVLRELEIMEGLQIEARREPTFTAYFLHGEVPAGRIFNDGKGGITVEQISHAVAPSVWEETQRKLDVRNKLILENPHLRDMPKPPAQFLTSEIKDFADDEFETDAPDFESFAESVEAEEMSKNSQTIEKETTETEPETQPEEEKKLMPPVKTTAKSAKTPKYTAYQPADFYEFGKRNLKQSAIARHYQVTSGSIKHQFKKAAILDAYERGLTEFRAALEIAPATDAAALTTKIPAKTEIAVPENIEILAPPMTAVEIAPRHEETISFLMENGNEKTKQGICKVLDQLLDAHPENAPETAIEKIPSELFERLNRRRKNTGAENLQNLENSAPSAQFKTITVGANGEKLLIGFDGNFFDLDTKARELMNSFADLAQKFKREK